MKKIVMVLFVVIVIISYMSLFSACVRFPGEENDSQERQDNDQNTFLNLQGLDFYLLDDDTYGVKIGRATELSKIVIPEKYCDKSVTIIMGSGFKPTVELGKDCIYRLSEISIPASIIEIQDMAFYMCTNLEKVSIAENSHLEKIGEMAFACCKIKEIKLPNSLLYIGSQAFWNSNLKRIQIPKSVEYIGSKAFCKSTKYDLCASILCESSESKESWEKNWYLLYDNIYDGEKLFGVPYFFRAPGDMKSETNFDGKFWSYDNENQIYEIWSYVLEEKTWKITYKYQLINGETYSVSL